MSKFTLIQNGLPNATLVVAANPRQATQLAVAEFQHYLQKMTGSKLRVVTDDNYPLDGNLVFIGESRFTRRLGYKNDDFFSDESIIQTGVSPLVVKKGYQYLLIMGRDHDSYGAIKYEPPYPIQFKVDDEFKDFSFQDDYGTMYGVIDFLERFGVRWFLPGEIGEVIPTHTTMEIEEDCRRRPWAKHRFVVPWIFPASYYAWDKVCLHDNRTYIPKDKMVKELPAKKSATVDQKLRYLRRDTQLWWLHLKMKWEFWASHSYEWFYRRFVTDQRDKQRYNEYFAWHICTNEDQPCPKVIDKQGKIIENINNRPPINGWKNGDWTCPYCGEKSLEPRRSSQVCLTNPEVIKIFVETARKYFDTPKHKRELWGFYDKKKQFFPKWNGPYFSLSPNDSGANWCECESCKEARREKGDDEPKNVPESTHFGTFHDNGAVHKYGWNDNVSWYVWDFVRKVAEQLYETHPNEWVSCFAYLEYHRPPTVPGFKLPPNVAVQFCRPIVQEYIPGVKQWHEEAFAEWTALAKKVYLYEYFVFSRGVARFDPFPGWAPARIAEDLKKKEDMGLEGAYNEFSGIPIRGVGWPFADEIGGHKAWPNPVVDQINTYVWMKYLDDTSLTYLQSNQIPKPPKTQNFDLNDLLEDLFLKFYGKEASLHIWDFVNTVVDIYWDLLKRAYFAANVEVTKENKDKGKKYIWNIYYCTPEDLAKLTQLMDQARQGVQNSPLGQEKEYEIYRKRVELFYNAVYRMIRYFSEEFVKSGGKKELDYLKDYLGNCP